MIINKLSSIYRNRSSGRSFKTRFQATFGELAQDLQGLHEV